MADIKVSELPLAPSVTGSDVVIGNAGVTTSRISLEMLLSLPLSINAQTGTAYTFTLANAAQVNTFANADPVTVTLPLESEVAFPLGTVLALGQLGAGAVTLVAPGVTINGVLHGTATTTGQYAPFTLTKVGTDSWWLAGDVGAVTEGDPPVTEGYALLTSTSWVDTPSTSAWNLPAPSEIRIRIAPNTWIGNIHYFIGKSADASATTGGWYLRVDSEGNLRWRGGNSGASIIGSAVFNASDDGVAYWLRVVRQADGRVTMFRSLTEGDWQSIGSDSQNADPIPTNSVVPGLSTRGDGEVVGFAGRLYRARAWEGTAESGTLMWDFDPLLATPGTPANFQAATGEVWTFQGTGSSVVHE